MQSPANPQTLNRYSYCLNNPLKYVDPTGHIVTIPLVDAVIGLSEMGIDVGDMYQAAMALQEAWNAFAEAAPELAEYLEADTTPLIEIKWDPDMVYTGEASFKGKYKDDPSAFMTIRLNSSSDIYGDSGKTLVTLAHEAFHVGARLTLPGSYCTQDEEILAYSFGWSVGLESGYLWVKYTIFVKAIPYDYRNNGEVMELDKFNAIIESLIPGLLARDEVYSLLARSDRLLSLRDYAVKYWPWH